MAPAAASPPTAAGSTPAPGRLARRFAALAAAGQAGFVPFITAGDPDPETSFQLLSGLAAAGADVIELGVPFTDPMADGPSIQAANLRALKAGIRVRTILDMVARFRRQDPDTPLVLMGYMNPVHAFGVERFPAAAAAAGVDGLIVVDLPPEEDAPLRRAAGAIGLSVIRLATPTTDARRLPRVLEGSSGFLYYVSVAGVTGAGAATDAAIGAAVARLKAATSLPVAVGFGIRTPDRAAAVARQADAAVIGSAIVDRVAANLDADGRARPGLVEDVLGFVSGLAQAVHGARG